MLSRNHFLHQRYRIIRELGQGGFGKVYEALDDKLDCIVAIKERLAKMDSEKMRRAFEKEAKLLANLRHPVLPKVMDHFFAGQGQYLVMEFIEGDDLARLLSKWKQPFSVEQVLAWAEELLKALEYLHTRSEVILHRDIKPGNIKLTHEGEIFLLDFGLAKGYAGEMLVPESSQRSSSIHGYTAAYAPLEQFNNSGTNEQSDIYALGATLYHLLTGRAPVNAAQRYTKMEMEGRDPLLPAHEVYSAVPQHVSLVLTQAMAMSRRERLRSAAEMRQALIAARHEMAEANTEPFSSSSVRTSQRPGSHPSNPPVLTIASPTAPSPNPPGLQIEHAQESQRSNEASWPSQFTSEAGESSWASTVVESELHDEGGSTIPKNDTTQEADEEIERRKQEEELERQRPEVDRKESEERRVLEEAEERRRALATQEHLIDEEQARRQRGAEAARRAEEAGRLLEQEREAKRLRAEQEAPDATPSIVAAPEEESESPLSTMVAEPEIYRPSAAPQSSANPKLNYKLMVTAGIIVVLLLGTAVLAIFYFKDPAPSQTVQANQPNNNKLSSSGSSAAPNFNFKQSSGNQGGTVWSVVFSPDGTLAASAGNNTIVSVWDTTTWKLKRELKGHSDIINSVAFSPDGERIASGSKDKNILIWNIADGSPPRRLVGHGDQVLFLTLSSDGKILASGSGDRTIKLWNMETDKLIKTLEGHTNEVWSVAFTPDGKSLFSAGRDNSIIIWSVSTGALKKKIPVKEVYSLALSPDGETLASGHGDNTVKLWNLRKTELTMTLDGHSKYVSYLAFNQNGATLASASDDGTIMLWDVRSGKNTQTLRDSTNKSVKTLSFSPDGKTLLSGGENQSLNIWQVSQ